MVSILQITELATALPFRTCPGAPYNDTAPALAVLKKTPQIPTNATLEAKNTFYGNPKHLNYPGRWHREQPRAHRAGKLRF